MATTPNDPTARLPSQMQPSNLTDKQQTALQILADDPGHGDKYYVKNYEELSDGYIRYLNDSYPDVVSQMDVDGSRCEFVITDLALSIYHEVDVLSLEERPEVSYEDLEEDSVEEESVETGESTADKNLGTMIRCSEDQLFALIRDHPDADFARDVFEMIRD